MTPKGALYVMGGCSDQNGNTRSKEVGVCHIKMPSLFDLCAQAIGRSKLYSARQLANLGLPSELISETLLTDL
jgi:hypothetical protein